MGLGYMEIVPSNEQPKRRVNQIIERTGLSADYINEYNSMVSRLAAFSLENVKEDILQHGIRIKSYQEHFPEDQFENVITDQNRETAEQLNQIAKDFNQKLEI